MIESTLRKPLIKLFFLLFLHLVLLSVQVRNEQGRLLIRAAGLALVTPAASTYSYLTSGARSLLNRYVLLFGAERENRELRRQNAELKIKIDQLRSLDRLSERSRRYEVVESRFRFETRLVAVTWRSFPVFAQRLIINGGSAHGITKDAAVLSPEGVVGRVYVTTPISAEVELLNSAGAAAGALFSESRLQGVVQGNGSNELRLHFISVSDSVSTGETILTSGADQIYPKGIPIGEVTECVRGDVYWDIKVKSFVDFSRLEELMVVTSPSGRVRESGSETFLPGS